MRKLIKLIVDLLYLSLIEPMVKFWLTLVIELIKPTVELKLLEIRQMK